jgi:glycosyltransferase involved in cell wall biosynthesis
MATKSILFVCPYPEGKAPSQRLKFEQYFAIFRAAGYELDFESFQSMSFWNTAYSSKNILLKILWTIYGYAMRFLLMFRIRKYDIVYIHLWVTPLGPPIFEWFYTRLARKIIYDIDDLVYTENASAANSWMTKLKGKQKPVYLMKHADHIITTTSYLVDICRKYNQYVTSIPPSLDDKIIYPIKKNQEDRIRIGWLGSHSTEQYLELVRDAIQKINKEYDIRLILMGAENFSIDGLDIERYEWCQDKENEVLNKIDIALYPLRKELWSEGKFGGKLIQYFAAGLPSIVSNANASNREVIADGVNGLLVDNSVESWYLAMKKLIDNQQLRMQIGHNARQEFLNNYSIEANRMKYIHIFEAVL